MTVTIPRRLRTAVLALGLAFAVAGCYPATATPAPIMPGASLGVPKEIASRTIMFDCGTEVLDAALDNQNADARQCFVDRNAAKEEAEFITVSPTTVTGTTSYTVFITTYYRTFKDGHVEIVTDGRQSAQAGGNWSMRSCAGIELSTGTGPIPEWNGKDPCTSKVLTP